MPYNRQSASPKKFLFPPLPIYPTNSRLLLSHDLSQTSRVRASPSQPLRHPRVSRSAPLHPRRRTNPLPTSGGLNDQTQSPHFQKPILRSSRLSQAQMSRLNM